MALGLRCVSMIADRLADGVAVVTVCVCAALAVVIVMTMLLVDFVVNQVCKHTCDDSYNK